MTALAGLTGGLALAGLILLAAELTGRLRAAGQPPRRPVGVSPAVRRRLLVAAVAGLTALILTRWPVALVAAAAAAFFLPAIVSTRAARQRAAVLEGLEQWTRRLSDMLTASRGLEDALQASARNAPPAIDPAVSALSRRLTARLGTEYALREFAADIDDPAGDRIAAALIIATGRRGGGVRDVLNALAVMLARDVAARREIEADRAQHRTTVKWLTLFVAGFTVFAVLNRSYSAPYGTGAGQVVLALVTCLYAGGLWWLHRLAAEAAPGRFLAAEHSRARVSRAERAAQERPVRARLRLAGGWRAPERGRAQ
ncbi:MAG TPA: type II secretion system F family protein [Streptosporangiaceae bacterium]